MDANENEGSSMENLMIDRKIFSEESFRKTYGYKEEENDSVKDKIYNAFKPKETNPARYLKQFIFGVIPILHWLPRYKVKKWLLADLISGLTIGIMHIPQGMSYALLAGQHPVYGLYNSFLPVILYSVLGTSRHTAMGTFALSSLMLGNAMESLAPDPGTSDEAVWEELYDRRIQLGSAIMFIGGIFLFALSVLRVGSVVIYLSDPMISGFTFGAAVHILSSQFKGLLGVSIRGYAGPLNLIWLLRDLILALVNLDDAGKVKTTATVIISIICIIFLVTLKELNIRYKEKIPLGLPLPGEMIVVIVGTGVSYGVNLAEKYGVNIIGNIPTGIPAPVAPALNEIPYVVGYAIPIVIVGYSVSVSIAKIFGNKFGYEIRPNQELVAYGISNTVCSFFSCFPAFPSMSRSCVQVESGGKTQIVGFVASIVVLLVLLVIGPLFSSIPKACLAAIICVAMKGMLKRALDLKGLWKTSKLDFATWLVAALGTLLLDVVYGLCVGVGFTLLCIVFRTQLVTSESIQQIGSTELYRKSDRFDEQVETDEGIRIGAFRGPLHYVNKESFRKTLIEISGIDPVVALVKQRKAEKKLKKKKERAEKDRRRSENEAVTVTTGDSAVINTTFTHSGEAQFTDSVSTSSGDVYISFDSKIVQKIRFLIIDCSQVSFMDSVGAKAVSTVSR